MKTFGNAILWLLLLAISRSAWGELPPQFPNYSTERFTAEHGLPQAEIRQIAQSADGYLWLGTATGPVRFDGEQFTQYDRRNTPTMPDDNVTAMATDRTGRIWFGTLKGLLRWDRSQMTSVIIEADVSTPVITALVASGDGGMWAATPGAIIRLSPGSLHSFARPPILGNATIGTLIELPNGHLLVGNTGGWSELNPGNGSYATPFGEVVPGPSTRTLVFPTDGKGQAWAVTPEGVKYHHNGTWELKLAFPGEFADEPFGIFPDPTGGVIVWLRRWGVYRWENEQTGFVRLDSTNPGWLRRPVSLLRDAENNLWVAGSDGLVRLHQRCASLWGSAQKLPSNSCWSAKLGADGKLWVGTQIGLFLLDQNGVLSRPTGPLQTNAIRLVLPMRNGRVWVATPDRLFWSDAPETSAAWQPFALNGRRAQVLSEGNDGSLWLGSDSGVIKLAGDPPVPVHFSNEERLATIDVTAIHEDGSGAVWFGSHGAGVFRLHKAAVERFAGPEKFGDDHIGCIHEDSKGGLWFGTGRGITGYLAGRWHSFSRDQGLDDQLVQGIYEDAANNFWLAGSRSIRRVARMDLEAVAAKKSSQVRVHHLGALDGLEESDFSAPGGTFDRQGQLWLPTEQGLLQIDPRLVQESHKPLAIVIKEASFNGRSFDEGEVARFCTAEADERAATKDTQRMKIPRKEGHNVQLRFGAITFQQPNKVRFRYRLGGHEDAWREVGDKREAAYSDLPPGSYDFEVQAANAQGLWNLHGRIFRFSLVAPFYETRWFFVAFFLVLMAVGFALARRHFLGKEQRLRGDRFALESERGRIARDLHDDLGANLTGLAMQAEIAGTQITGPGAEELRRFAVTTRGLAQRLREVIWAVDPESDTLESLVSFLGQQTDELLGPTHLRYRFETTPNLPAVKLRAGTRHQLAMSAREALNNVLKFAQAKNVKVTLEVIDGILALSVRDDGVGLPAGPATASGRPVIGGNGLKNMGVRIRELGGTFRVSNQPEGGTLVRLEVPLAAVMAVESKSENSEESAHEHQSRNR